MNESPIDPSDEAAPESSANADGEMPNEESSANADGEVPDDESTADADPGDTSDDTPSERDPAAERLVEAFEEAAGEEAVADAAIEAALEETVAEAVADAAAVEAAVDDAIEDTFEERVTEAVDSGLDGAELEEAVAEAAADADMQEAVADAAIVEALEETVEEAVEDAAAVEAMSDAAIVGELADEVESLAADAEQAEASETEPAAEAEPAAEVAPARRSRAKAKDARQADGSAEEPGEGGRDPFRGPGDWYVVHTYAGYENKVKTNLESRIHTMQMEDKIFDVHIPMEDVMEIKGGKKQVVQRKVFPGYLLVKMIYDNDSWYVVRNTPGVTGFVAAGTGSKPTPLSRREVEKILSVKKEEVKPQFRLGFEEGDVVRIISGPFADFNGTISEINLDQSKLKVLVNIFDRETPVELSFDQVAKV
jgi:transcription termination/antitermination protein NusG